MLKPLIVVCVALVATSSSATEWMYCSDAASDAEIGLLLGTLDVLMPAGVTLRVPNRQWTSSPAYGDGAAIAVGQAFGNGSEMLVDLLDGDLNARVAELRLSRAEEGETVATGGTLRVLGIGAWAVSCSEG